MKYKSLDSFQINRGTVYVVENEKERDNFSDFIGKKVEINGIVYECDGVEYFAIRPCRKGASIGLLVRDTEK